MEPWLTVQSVTVAKQSNAQSAEVLERFKAKPVQTVAAQEKLSAKNAAAPGKRKETNRLEQTTAQGNIIISIIQALLWITI
jgi:hypothetical protein